MGNNGGRRQRRRVYLDQTEDVALMKRLDFTPGETGVDYTRPVDPADVAQIIEDRKAHGTMIKFGDRHRPAERYRDKTTPRKKGRTKMKLTPYILAPAVLALATGPLAAEPLFWSTQAKPVEESQAMRDQVLAGFEGGVD
jgi:hypothetical protein